VLPNKILVSEDCRQIHNEKTGCDLRGIVEEGGDDRTNRRQRGPKALTGSGGRVPVMGGAIGVEGLGAHRSEGRQRSVRAGKPRVCGPGQEG